MLRGFLPRFNARFGVPAAQPGSAYRPLPLGLQLQGVLCFKYQRTVARDVRARHAVPLRWPHSSAPARAQPPQLCPGPSGGPGEAGWQPFGKLRACPERSEGTCLAVCYQGRVVASREAPAHPVTLRARRNVPPSPKASLPKTGSSDREGAHRKVEDSTRRADAISVRPKPGPNHPWRRALLTKSLAT